MAPRTVRCLPAVAHHAATVSKHTPQTAHGAGAVPDVNLARRLARNFSKPEYYEGRLSRGTPYAWSSHCSHPGWHGSFTDICRSASGTRAGLIY
jgi:hypothetical protein